MDKLDSYALKNSFKELDDADMRKVYARLLDDYNEIVEITNAFIRMTRAFPNY